MNFRQEMIAARKGAYSVEGVRSRSRAQVKRYSVKSASSTEAWDEVADVRNGKKEDFVKTSYLYKSTKKQDDVDPDADLKACMF